MKGNVEGYTYTELWFRGEHYRRSAPVSPTGRPGMEYEMTAGMHSPMGTGRLPVRPA